MEMITISKEELTALLRQIIREEMQTALQRTEPKAEEKEYLTTKEAVIFSGYSDATLYCYASRGKITKFKRSGKAFFSRAELANLMGIDPCPTQS